MHLVRSNINSVLLIVSDILGTQTPYSWRTIQAPYELGFKVRFGQCIRYACFCIFYTVLLHCIFISFTSSY
jgi:hypothetical protein